MDARGHPCVASGSNCAPPRRIVFAINIIPPISESCAEGELRNRSDDRHPLSLVDPLKLVHKLNGSWVERDDVTLGNVFHSVKFIRRWYRPTEMSQMWPSQSAHFRALDLGSVGGWIRRWLDILASPFERGGVGSRSLASLPQTRAEEKEGGVGDGANAVPPPRLLHSSETILRSGSIPVGAVAAGMASNLPRRQLRVHRELLPRLATRIRPKPPSMPPTGQAAAEPDPGGKLVPPPPLPSIFPHATPLRPPRLPGPLLVPCRRDPLRHERIDDPGTRRNRDGTPPRSLAPHGRRILPLPSARRSRAWESAR